MSAYRYSLLVSASPQQNNALLREVWSFRHSFGLDAPVVIFEGTKERLRLRVGDLGFVLGIQQPSSSASPTPMPRPRLVLVRGGRS